MVIDERAAEAWDRELEELFLRTGHSSGGSNGVGGCATTSAARSARSAAAEEGGVPVLDDTDFAKKGITSAGVHRQYSGTADRTDKLPDRHLRRLHHHPRPRSGGPRAVSAQVLDRQPRPLPCRPHSRRSDLRHQARPGQGHSAAGPASPLPLAWATADAAYSQKRRLRRMLEEAGLGYLLAVPNPIRCHVLDASTHRCRTRR
ncbi:transposase [Streptomyces milbemycinicus]|uniref:Transposase n=1 Tax=Streptomyces milbemycinicus TaxID=476552 RepID=A0ABW8M4T9_9ACTN